MVAVAVVGTGVGRRRLVAASGSIGRVGARVRARADASSWAWPSGSSGSSGSSFAAAVSESCAQSLVYYL